jgi:HK97 family phage major capsid protein
MNRAFPGRGPEVEERYQRAGHFLLATMFDKENSKTWCHKKGVVIGKATGEGIGSAGGFLVPTELETAILDMRDSFGSFRRRACVWPMGSDSSVFPRRTGTAVAAFVGEGASADTGASTTIGMDGVNLTAKKLAAMVKLSSELTEDSIVDLVNYVAYEMAWALAAKEDDCAFNGDGTSAYGGMRGITQIVLDGNHGKAKVTAASGHNTFALLDSTDLGALAGAVRASAIPRAAWFVSQVGLGNTFQRLAGASGALQMSEADGIPTATYNGFPIILCQKLPQSTSSLTGTAMMAFGDMYAGAVLGQRRGLTIARTSDRYLDTDQIAVLVTERFDAVVHDMGDNSTAGSLAVLVAP